MTKDFFMKRALCIINFYFSFRMSNFDFRFGRRFQLVFFCFCDESAEKSKIIGSVTVGEESLRNAMILVCIRPNSS